MKTTKPIKRIKVPNKIMDALVFSLFQKEIINCERKMENAKKQASYTPFWHPTNIPMPMLDVTLPPFKMISQKDVDKYFLKYNESTHSICGSNSPYFSLYSNNAHNDLQVGLNSVSWNAEEDKNNLKNPEVEFYLVSLFAENIDGKYMFYDR